MKNEAVKAGIKFEKVVMVMINLAIGKLVHPLYNQVVTDTTMTGPDM